jgi:hypothetical protein
MDKVPSVKLNALQKLAPSDVRLLWVNDWYDGPLEAVVEHRGERCLMVLHHQKLASDKPYQWLVLRLSREQCEDEERWHALFAEQVGDHWCFHAGIDLHGSPADNRDPARFYDAFKMRTPLDLTKNESVGWLDEMPVG